MFETGQLDEGMDIFWIYCNNVPVVNCVCSSLIQTGQCLDFRPMANDTKTGITWKL